VSSHQRPRLLFVCSRNLRRSLTAEHLLRRSSLCEVRSVGTASSARRQVRESDIEWADIVFAMEQSHVSQLRERFRDALEGRELTCLDIPDDYGYMEPDLVDALEVTIAPYLI
jgi:predicted protein tyrosine phosphatase